jgi:hypothetical protein
MTLRTATRLMKGCVRPGGVVLAQRVLFGESAADQQLSVMLSAARVWESACWLTQRS